MRTPTEQDELRGIRNMTGNPDIYDMASASAEVSTEVEEQIHNLMKSLDSTEGRARFLVDIAFTEKRSMHKPFAGVITVFTNGGFAHGGGDELVYLCPKKVERDGFTKNCATPIPPNLVKGKVAICPECRGVSKDVELCGQTFAKLAMQHWIELVTKFYVRLGHNADLRIAVFNDDLRGNAFAAQMGSDHANDKLNQIRTERQWVRYSLDALVRDTGSGKSVENCIAAFLRA